MRLFLCSNPPSLEQEAMFRAEAGTKGFVLLLEDSEDDAFFLQRAWKAHGLTEPIFRVENGLRAKQLLLSRLTGASCPRLIITDLKMPECDGFEFLQWLRSQPKLQAIRCVVLSSSQEIRDTCKARVSGADDFFAKPGNAKAYSQVVKHISVHLGQSEPLDVLCQTLAPLNPSNEWMDT